MTKSRPESPADSTAQRQTIYRLLMKHHDDLHEFALAMTGNFALAEEAMQEMAVTVCEHWEDFRPGTNFRAWARTILRNRVYSLGRKRRKSVLLAPEVVDLLESAAEEREESPLENYQVALRDCLGRLNDRARRLIELRYDGDHPCEEIAEAMTMKVNAVYKALSRIRTALADCVRSRVSMEELP